ncbi:outer membrane beta-barrel protein [Pedobacter sp. LMG 31464]|uniref:Outer membrane beta-barrel protein n=1 Tax=Pedobacter planticolens TaxID=2679964 RepID=A0A923E050_9SPHI|nr:outer membrane beta-barrel protein [Pedobacter planticolens]MBB2145134.1 outer membrane beta-barrel protein [Pedobacter planticolens]
MKKLLILITIIIASNSLMAQKTKFGVKAGLNFPSLQPRTSFSPGSEYKISAKLLLGVFTTTPVGKATTLQTGLNFSVKGNKSVEQHNSISFGYPVPYTTDRNINLAYLEIPVNLLYNKDVKIGTVHVGGGLYGAYAIGGRIRSIDKRNIYIKRGSAESIEFGDQPTELKSGDYGLNALAGFRLKNGIGIDLNYGFGLANISNNDAFKSHNRVAGFALNYLF